MAESSMRNDDRAVVPDEEADAAQKSHEESGVDDPKPGSILCDALILCADPDGLSTRQLVDYCVEARRMPRLRAQQLVRRGLREGVSTGFVSKRRHCYVLGSAMNDEMTTALGEGAGVVATVMVDAARRRRRRTGRGGRRSRRRRRRRSRRGDGDD